MHTKGENRTTTIATILVGIALTIAFAVGEDGWKRPVSMPNADAQYYYVYLPSLVLDGDLDFANEYRITKNYYRWTKTQTGRYGNPFGIGPALFQLPGFLLGHGIAAIAGDQRDGFSRYEGFFATWACIPATLGALLLAYRLARRRFGAAAAFLGPLIAIAAGPVLYYTIRQPGYAHPYATLFATWLIERWDASYDRPRTLRTWIVLGALAGAATLARPQLVVWALLLPIAGIDDLRKREAPLKTLLLRWAAGAAVCFVVFLPQLIAWKSIYGGWYVVPQGDGFMRWDDPAWSETLFSSRNGLFPWSPLYAPMVLGVIALARTSVRLPLALLLGLLAQAEINGAAWDWWAGGSYGGRRFDSTFVVFAVGAAALLSLAGRALARGRGAAARARDRIVAAVAGLAVVAAILIAIANIELTMQTSVISARISGGSVPSKVWEQRVGGARGWLAARLAEASTFPVRLGFAWKHGVDLDAYDRLVGVHHLGELYPPLVADRDKRTDRIHVTSPPPFTSGLAPSAKRARLTADRAVVRFGINRLDPLTLRIAVETTGHVIARWNDAVAERTGTGVLVLEGVAPRGVNTLVIEAPAGTLVAPIDISVKR